MADVLDIYNAEEFEVDDEGDRKYHLVWIIWWSYSEKSSLHFPCMNLIS